MAPRWITLWLLLASHCFDVELFPTDDAHTYTVQPGTNFGSANILMLGAARQVYLKFGFSVLPTGLSGASVAKATLRLWPNYLLRNGSLQVHEITGPWDEKTITQKTSPTVDATVEASTDVSAALGKRWLEVDVTRLVQDWVDGARTNHGLALTTHTTSFGAWFDSKENPTTGHQPQLEVVLVNPGPQGLPGIPGLPGEKGRSRPKG